MLLSLAVPCDGGDISDIGVEIYIYIYLKVCMEADDRIGYPCLAASQHAEAAGPEHGPDGDVT